MAFWNCTERDEAMNEASTYAKQAAVDMSNPRIFAAFPLRMGAPEHGGNDGIAPAHGLMVAEPEVKTKRPPKYKVILLNDDYTPMDFVVMVLEQVFRKPHQDALHVMLEVHQKGAGLAGIYTRDVAETKTAQVLEYARINDYPLQCTLEPES